METEEQEWIRLRRELEELTVYTQSKTQEQFFLTKKTKNPMRFVLVIQPQIARELDEQLAREKQGLAEDLERAKRASELKVSTQQLSDG